MEPAGPMSISQPTSLRLSRPNKKVLMVPMPKLPLPIMNTFLYHTRRPGILVSITDVSVMLASVELIARL